MQALPGAHGAHGALGSPPAKDDEDTEDAVLARFGDLPAVPRQQPAPGSDREPSPLARMALARARMRVIVPLDVVTFVAACPACGADCEWTQEREETRVHSYQNCDCLP